MNVVYEDERLIAVEKRRGILVIPGRGDSGEPTLQDLAASRLGKKAFVVHRLDREATGLVIFAKSAESHAELSQAFEGRAVRKTYLAAVLGAVERDGRVDSSLREFGSGRTAPSPLGKPSLTLYKPLSRAPSAALLEIELVTGRRHQIRAHLASIQRPILGDPLYGPPPRPVGGAARLMLHAWRLSLPGVERELVCPPDAEFARELQARGLSLT